MIQNMNDLYGCKLSAFDGEIGHFKDCYFNDQAWVVRYLIADTGHWIPGRQVLLTPHVVGSCNSVSKTMPVHLSKLQIEQSPSIDLRQPVSRQYEIEHYNYFSLPYYWDGAGLWGTGNYPMVMAIPSWGKSTRERHHHAKDQHLRSAREVIGYAIRTADGVMGTVCGILIDDTRWTITEIIVETGHWYAGKKIRLLPEHIKQINYTESTVVVNLTQEDLHMTEKGDVARSSTVSI